MTTKALRNIFSVNLSVKKSESVLVFTDRISTSEVLRENTPHPNPLPQGERGNIRTLTQGEREIRGLLLPQGERELNNPPPLTAMARRGGGEGEGETNVFSGKNDLCRRERLRDIAILIAETGKSFCKKILYHEYPATGSHGAEPPKELWAKAFGEKAFNELKAQKLLARLINKKAKDSDMRRAEEIITRNKRHAVNAVIALSNYSTSHTRFRDLLTRICKTRYASMPLFDAAMLEGAMNVDWRLIDRRTRSIARIVNKAEVVEIKTPNGTSISFSKKGRKAESDTGILTAPGAFGNLPAGEVYLAPVEGTAEGRLVLEFAPTRQLKSPVALTVKNGFVEEVSGDDEYAGYLRAKLSERRENANIAELGIGTNDMAKRPDNILESEKILGTIHIALGDNSSFGGNVCTPFHQDFVFFKPTLTLIDKNGKKALLMKDGKFTISSFRT